MQELIYVIPPPGVNWLDVAAALQLELLLTLFAIVFGIGGILRELCDRVK